MAPVNIERVVSVTSEDPLNPAGNLLKKDYNNKKWKCKGTGEKQIAVILQLEKPTCIKSVDIGNEFSAFIEILVGRSSSPDTPYEVLLVTSSLMTLQEAKYGTNGNSVRFFKENNLSKPTSNEKWDRVKIVCSQPYNKNIQYGLSFMVLHESETKDDPSPLGKFKLKAEEPDDPISIGNLFARRKDTTVPDLKGAAAIRAASLPDRVKFEDAKHGINPNKMNGQESPKTSIKNALNRTQDASPQLGPARGNATPRNKKLPNGDESKRRQPTGLNGARKRNSTDSVKTTPKKQKLAPTVGKVNQRIEKPFGKLLEGVSFVISGFQNPLRGEIRNKALAMGAKYKGDWDSTCTHLVCAFINTPKFNQVKGQGKIVKKDWIEECYSRRIRLPWRRYALDRRDLSDPVSEEEIFEQIDNPAPVLKDHRRSVNSDSEDTEDEIERVRQKQNEIQKVKQSSDDCKPSTSLQVDFRPASKTKDDDEEPCINEISIYDMDTDVEEQDTESEKRVLPPLPEIFDGFKFCLSMTLVSEERVKLRRYIIAHKGSLADRVSEDVDTVISEDVVEAQKLKEEYPDLTVVKPEWVWKSHDADKQLPTSPYEV